METSYRINNTYQAPTTLVKKWALHHLDLQNGPTVTWSLTFVDHGFAVLFAVWSYFLPRYFNLFESSKKRIILTWVIFKPFIARFPLKLLLINKNLIKMVRSLWLVFIIVLASFHQTEAFDVIEFIEELFDDHDDDK